MSPWVHALMDHPVSRFLFGRKGFLPITHLCRAHLPPAVYGALMEGAFHVLFRWRCAHFGDAQHRSAIFAHTFSSASITNFRHWFQIIQHGAFLHYRHPDAPGVTSGIKYPTQHITTPLYLMAGSKDTISDKTRLLRNLPPATTTWMEVEGYNHLDFLWAPDLPEKCFGRILELVAQHATDAGGPHEAKEEEEEGKGKSCAHE